MKVSDAMREYRKLLLNYGFSPEDATRSVVEDLLHALKNSEANLAAARSINCALIGKLKKIVAQHSEISKPEPHDCIEEPKP